MATKRRSLAERNAQAIRGEAEPQQVTTEALKVTPKSKKPAAAGAADGLTRISAWLPREQYDAARGAYLTSFSSEEVDTFGQWVTSAVHTFAALKPSVRADALDRQGNEKGGDGAPRNFVVSPDAVEAMTEAMRQDQAEGKWLSKSAWFAAALVYAAEDARTTAGGVLPTPPARLPFRRSR